MHILEDTNKENLICQTFIKSINIFFSDAEIIQVSDYKTPKIDKVSRVFRYDCDINKIIEFIKKDLNNDDYLMIKASNATGFNQIVKDIKGFK